MQCCEQLTKVGLAQKEKRDAELRIFKSSYSKACDKNQLMSVKKIEEFEEKLSKVIAMWIAMGLCGYSLESCAFLCSFFTAE